MNGRGLLVRILPPVAAAAVRALGGTLRFTVAGTGELQPLWAQGRPLVYAVWHGQILLAPWLTTRLCRSEGARIPRVLASRSFEGELVSRFARSFGLRAARGSSSRGGARAMRELAAAIAAGEDVAVIPDGPRGPREVAQPGVVMLASLTGAPVVPLAIAARPARRLRSWDRFMVPLPFARAAAVLGPPLEVGRDEDREAARRRVERALGDASAAAGRMVGT